MTAGTSLPGPGNGNDREDGGKPAQGAGDVGRRLVDAMAAVEELPVLLESKSRFMGLLEEERQAGDLVAGVESDPGLTIAVLRAAQKSGQRAVRGAAAAVRSTSEPDLLAAVTNVPTLDYFESAPTWGTAPQRFRLHAVAVKRIADRLGDETGFAERDELLTAALLHDIGKLVLLQADPDYADRLDDGSATPEERLVRERERFGVDHAAIGSLLLGRWSVSTRISSAVDRHHSDDSGGLAAIIGLADMLAHHAAGQAVDHRRLVRLARVAGLEDAALRDLLHGLPGMGDGKRPGREPSPLSRRERDVLRLLAEGNRYKQIGAALGTSESTVRSQINSVYKKLAVVDRAQAVLLAKDRGWI